MADGNSDASPQSIDAAIAAAVALHEAGRADAAEAAYREILASHPDHPGVNHNLALLAAGRGELESALALLDRVLASDPDHVHAHLNRGGVLQELGRWDAARASYRRAADLDPAGAEALARCGDIAMAQGDAAAAAADYRAALARNDGHYGARLGLGLALAALGQLEPAMAQFGWTAAWRRAAADREAATATGARLRHDRDQLRYLAQHGVAGAEFTTLADEYDSVALELETGTTLLRENQLQRIAAGFGRPLHIADAPALAGPALSPELDYGAIRRDYDGNAQGVCWFDDLLSPATLAALRRFLLESTIWYDHRHIEGFLAAYLEDGMACPLLLQIAGELRRALPEILGPHPLRQAWAFKCLTGAHGIAPHADTAAVSINFWLTPDHANLEPDGGGLVVCRARPPEGWKSRDYEADMAEIRDFMADHAGAHLSVPYRQNRAVLFNSALFHESDAVRFRSGYANHRINVTMLFGSPDSG